MVDIDVLIFSKIEEVLVPLGDDVEELQTVHRFLDGALLPLELDFPRHRKWVVHVDRCLEFPIHGPDFDIPVLRSRDELLLWHRNKA